MGTSVPSAIQDRILAASSPSMNFRTHAKPGYSLDRADFLAVASVPYIYPSSCLLFLHYANQKTDPLWRSPHGLPRARYGRQASKHPQGTEEGSISRLNSAKDGHFRWIPVWSNKPSDSTFHITTGVTSVWVTMMCSLVDQARG